MQRRELVAELLTATRVELVLVEVLRALVAGLPLLSDSCGPPRSIAASAASIRSRSRSSNSLARASSMPEA
jgi:hypothetical protein